MENEITSINLFAASVHYSVGKMSKSELEGAYFDTLNENVLLKKTVHEQNKEIRRLEIFFGNHSNGLHQKVEHSMTPTLDDIRMKDMQMKNKFLIEKVNVLTHQLLQQSHFHAQAHSCLKKASSSMSGLRHKNELENTEEENASINMSISDEDSSCDPNTIDENSSIINAYECLATNVDNLRWKLLVKQSNNEKEMVSANADGEINVLRKTIEILNEDYDNVCSQLGQVHLKYSELQSKLMELNSLKKSYKLLEEKLRDIREEREMLREVNEKLLALNENGDESQISILKERCDTNYKKYELKNI